MASKQPYRTLMLSPYPASQSLYLAHLSHEVAKHPGSDADPSDAITRRHHPRTAGLQQRPGVGAPQQLLAPSRHINVLAAGKQLHCNLHKWCGSRKGL